MRKIIIILSCCILVLLAGYSSYRGYEIWKEGHWMSLAKSFAAKSDAHNELLCLEQVLRYNPKDVQACRMMANLAEAGRSQAALTWRQKVLELDPGSLTDRLALVETAVVFHNLALATNTLAAADPSARKTAAYHDIAGTVAIEEDNPQKAEQEFAEAVRLDPANPLPAMNLAVVRLHQTNALDMAEARITLKRISMNATNAAIRNKAKRELILDALRFKDNNTALSLSKDLAEQTNADFGDKLLRLEVLRFLNRDDYASALAACEREAANRSDKLSQLTMWMMERRLFSQALGWLQTLPPSTRTNMPVSMLAAQCRMLTKDWSGLQKSISRENWGKLEFMRHAYLARALRQQGLSGASKAEWDVAFRAANGASAGLTALFHMAAEWSWPDEAQQVLWTIVKSYPGEKWAYNDLMGALYASGSTRPLMQLFGIQANRDPSDLDAKNNLALTAMLLHAQELAPYDAARTVYQAAPKNPSYASTYAFSLYLQGKNAEALKIMQELAPKALQDPETAGYYGMILKANGNTAQAETYLRLAAKARALPEEHAMFERALSGI